MSDGNGNIRLPSNLCWLNLKLKSTILIWQHYYYWKSIFYPQDSCELMRDCKVCAKSCTDPRQKGWPVAASAHETAQVTHKTPSNSKIGSFTRTSMCGSASAELCGPSLGPIGTQSAYLQTKPQHFAQCNIVLNCAWLEKCLIWQWLKVRWLISWMANNPSDVK